MTTATAIQVAGFSEVVSGGLSTFYLSIVDEGMVTTTDTPANTQYRPRIINPEQFYVERNPVVWVEGDATVQSAAFGTLQLDNYDGYFNALLTANARDSIIVVKSVPAGILLSANVVSSAPTLLTCIIDDVRSDSEDVLDITVKDIIARLDKVLPALFCEPFVASGAANQMVPMSFGSVRNRKPLLIDNANRIFLMHDAPVPNVTKVADMAAPLDPHSSPPQYTGAVSNSGLQVAVMPDGVLTVDCSSYGSQSAIPGAADVLAGSGMFNGTWAGSPAVPPGWLFHDGAAPGGSTITQGPANYVSSGATGMILSSTSSWAGYAPNMTYVGTTTNVLKAGYSYRLNFTLNGVYGNPPSDPSLRSGGIMVATALTANAKDYIAGFALPLTYGGNYLSPHNYSFEFTMPAGSDCPLYFILSASEISTGNPNGTFQAILCNVVLEQLGQFTDLPQSGIPFADYLTEILVNRAGEASTIFNAVEAAKVTTNDTDGSLIPWGIAFDTPPNILQGCLQPPLSMRGFVAFSDNLGVLRFRRIADPSNPIGRVVKADFNASNVKRPITTEVAYFKNLTTILGTRANQYVFNPSDFVTDQAIVTQDVKTRYSRKSQFWSTSGYFPASTYSSAVSAPVFDTCLDNEADGQIEIDRIISIVRPQVYSDGTTTTGQRIYVTFTAYYDDPAAVGATITAAVTDLMYGDIIKFTYPTPINGTWFTNAYGLIVGWRIYPFANQIQLKVMI